MQGSVYKKCGCLGPDGKQLGRQCPKLKKKDGGWSTRHGSWYVSYSVYVKGTRKQKTKGGFTSAADARAFVDQFKQRVASGEDTTRDKLTVGEWCQEWITSKQGLRANTRASYQGHIDRYIRPEIGHILLRDLRPGHVSAMLKRCKGKGVTAQRTRATLRASLNSAMKQRLISHNAAQEVELPSATKVKPLVWTRTRVEEYCRTGKKPSSVMCWTAAQTGAFLDHTADDRLSAMWQLYLTRGPRRGELAGLRWSDLDLDDGTMTISTQRIVVRGVIQEGPPKSDAGGRVVALGAANVAALRLHAAQSKRERLAAGPRWFHTPHVFTDELGRPLDPTWISDRWEELVTASGQPPVRLHDARHTAITIMLASGSAAITVANQVGHASISTTVGVYASTYPEVAAEAADAATAMIPRSREDGAGAS